MRRAWSASSRDESSDAVGAEAEKVRKNGAAHKQRIEPRGGFVAACFGSRCAWGDGAIREDFDDRVEIQINALRLIPAVVAKAGQHFIDAVRGRRKTDLVKKDAGERIPSEEFAKPSDRLLARSRIVRA